MENTAIKTEYTVTVKKVLKANFLSSTTKAAMNSGMLRTKAVIEGSNIATTVALSLSLVTIL